MSDEGEIKCNQVDCDAMAMVRVKWPATAPGEEYPCMCISHAAWAIKVCEAMGSRCDVEALPQGLAFVREIEDLLAGRDPEATATIRGRNLELD